MNIIIILILAVGTLAYVGYPLFGEDKRSRTRRRATASVQQFGIDVEESELDIEMGRLSAQDYAPADRTAGSSTTGTSEEDEIERQVRALRKQRAQQQNSKSSTSKRKG